jgi:uncharacterized membrane protein YedE/YeeE
LFGEDFYKVSDQSITLQLIFGALCFGFGWGLSGIEIATWLLQFSVFTYSIGLVFGAFMIGGMYIAHMIESRAK